MSKDKATLATIAYNKMKQNRKAQKVPLTRLFLTAADKKKLLKHGCDVLRGVLGKQKALVHTVSLGHLASTRLPVKGKVEETNDRFLILTFQYEPKNHDKVMKLLSEPLMDADRDSDAGAQCAVQGWSYHLGEVDDGEAMRMGDEWSYGEEVDEDERVIEMDRGFGYVWFRAGSTVAEDKVFFDGHRDD